MISQHFLDNDISALIAKKPIRFETSIYEGKIEGRMSQNSDLGPGFNFIKCRN